MQAIIIVLSIFSVIAFLLLFSVAFHFSYIDNKNYFIKLSFIGIKYTIYPNKKVERLEKRAGQKAEKQIKKQTKNIKREKEETDIKALIFTIIDIIKSVIDPTKFMLRHLRITDLDAVIIVATDDAAQTAKEYGYISSAVYGGVSALKNLIIVKVKNIFVGYDFNCTQTVSKVFFKVKLRGFIILIAVVRMIKNYLVNTYKRTHENKNTNLQGGA